MFTMETSARKLDDSARIVNTPVRVVRGVTFRGNDLIQLGFEGSEVEGFAKKHPHIAFGAMFAAVPIGILTAVFATTYAIIYPIGLLMGWL